jgi:hypothetical protein
MKRAATGAGIFITAAAELMILAGWLSARSIEVFAPNAEDMRAAGIRV